MKLILKLIYVTARKVLMIKVRACTGCYHNGIGNFGSFGRKEVEVTDVSKKSKFFRIVIQYIVHLKETFIIPRKVMIVMAIVTTLSISLSILWT